MVFVVWLEVWIEPPERAGERLVENGDTHVEKGCTVHLFHRICCFLIMRFERISLTALSTNAVEIGSRSRRRRP
jgi:hypothetical protein